MYSDHFWLCLEGLSVALAGDPLQVENCLLEYEQAYLKFPPTRRTEIKSQLDPIISGLSRLKIRIANSN